MLFNEYAELAAPKGLGLTADHHEIAELVYGALPQGGHAGHEATVAWAVKNRAIFEALAIERLARRRSVEIDLENLSEAVRERQRRCDFLEQQQTAERREHAEKIEALERALAARTEEARLERDAKFEAREELAETREYAHKAANDLATVKLAFRILSDAGVEAGR